MQYIQYYLGIGSEELIDGVEIECLNGSITKEGDEIYISRAMLTDCTSCKYYLGESNLPCAVNPTYTGKDYCQHYKKSNTED